MDNEQRHNCEMLAAALASGWTPLEFNMRNYCIKVDRNGWEKPIKADQYFCGTTACALGHAPYATGVEPLPNERWYEYGDRVFGVENTDVWDFLFDMDWPDDPLKAADRIAWILDNNEIYPCDHDDKYGENRWDGYFLKSGRTPGGWKLSDNLEIKVTAREAVNT